MPDQVGTRRQVWPPGRQFPQQAVGHRGIDQASQIVLLDYPTSTSTAAMDNATVWTSTVLGESDHSQAFLGTYVIEVSSDLATWEPATTNYASYITDNGTSVVFTLPPVPGKLFTRLRVTPY